MAAPVSPAKAKTYVVEHLDPELGDWSALEYKAIAKECTAAGAEFILSSVPTSLILPGEFADLPGFRLENESIEEVHKDSLDRICLLDPAAEHELSPDDAGKFDIFLFGGILGDDPPRGTIQNVEYSNNPLTDRARPDQRAAKERLPKSAPWPRPNDN